MSRLRKLIAELCPDGVEFLTLEDILSIKNGRDYKSFPAGDIPVYGSGGIMTYINTAMYDKPSVLIPRKGSLDKLYYVDSPFWNVDTIFYTEINSDKVIPKYVYYWLTGQHLERLNKAGGVPSLTQSVLNKVIVPVPPLPVQSEIVQILDHFAELTTQLQAQLTLELTARRKQYEYYRDKLMQNVTGEIIRIIDMLEQPITDGPHTTPTFVETGVPFVSVDSVWDGKIHFENMRGYITEEFDLECCKKYKPQKHDVYMVKSGSTTGKVAYVDTDIRFNIWSPLAAMRVNKKNSSRYLYHLLQTKFIQEQVKAKSSHGSQPNLSMRTLEQFQVKVPSLSEQEKIVTILDRFDALCNDLTSGLPAEIAARQKQYEYYRDKLLTFKELTA